MVDDTLFYEYLGQELWKDENGKYYFSDETQQLQGPYETYEEASEKSIEYGRWLNQCQCGDPGDCSEVH